MSGIDLMTFDSGSVCPELLLNSRIIPGARTLVFDRDGTINADKGYVHQISEFEFTLEFSRIIETLGEFKGNICVITNQGGASIGKYRKSDSRLFTEHLISVAKIYGITINLVVTCYHHNVDNCEYRKPAPGMLSKIESLIQSDSSMYLYVGNDKKDAEAAKARHITYLDIKSENFVEKFKDWLSAP